MILSVVILPAKILADGTHKLRISIAHNGTTRYFLTRFVVPSVDCLKNGVVTSKVGNASYINQQIRLQMNQIYEVYDTIEDSECYTCSQLVQVINDKIEFSKAKTFDYVAVEFLNVKENTCKESSYNIYKCQIEEFIKFAGTGLLLKLINPKKVWEYDKYLKSKYNQTTVGMIMRTFRSVVNFAKKRNYVEFDIDPFAEYTNPQTIARDCALPVSVLRQIRDFKTESKSIERARDIFMLSFYLCGMNIVDIIAIDLSCDVVSLVRQKTATRRMDNQKTEFTIQPEAREIINKYITKNGRINIYPKSNKKDIQSAKACINYALKIIAKEIGYNDRLFYYCARKTFTQLCFMNNIQERIIAYCIGDSFNNKTAMGYYVKSNKNLADSCIRKVLDFVGSDKTEDDLFSDNIVKDEQ